MKVCSLSSMIICDLCLLTVIEKKKNKKIRHTNEQSSYQGSKELNLMNE